jgi:SSS family solute:Na+ symporter
MMSSSDSMLLSGSSYFTRDVYEPLVGEADREALLGRAAVVGFALVAFALSLTATRSIVEIGNTAFGGFAQLALPVIAALYWPRTTRTGMLAAVAVAQLFYAGNLVVAVILGPFDSMGAVGAAYYLGWHPGIPGMVLSLLLVVGISAVTSRSPGEDAELYFAGQRVD